MSHDLQGRGVALALAIVGAWAGVLAWDMGVWAEGLPGAGLLPVVAAAMLCIFSLLAVVAAPVPAEAGRGTWPRFGVYLLTTAMFCTLPGVIGSLACFSIGLLLLFHRAEGLPLGASLMWAIVVGSGATAFFRLVLDVPLPDPILDFLLGY